MENSTNFVKLTQPRKEKKEVILGEILLKPIKVFEIISISQEIIFLSVIGWFETGKCAARRLTSHQSAILRR